MWFVIKPKYDAGMVLTIKKDACCLQTKRINLIFSMWLMSIMYVDNMTS